MKDQDSSLSKLLRDLQEREKELNCLYKVEEILNNQNNIDDAFNLILKVIPAGWRYPDKCKVSIEYRDKTYGPSATDIQLPSITENIQTGEEPSGKIIVFYVEELPGDTETAFLKEEKKLLENIADRISKYISHVRSKMFMEEWNLAKKEISGKKKGEWKIIIDLLKKTDPEMFIYISRKMSYHLCWNGIDEAVEYLQNLGTATYIDEPATGEINQPIPKMYFDALNNGIRIFEIASKHLNDNDILLNVQKWIQENRINFLIKTLVNLDSSLSEVTDAIRRFTHIVESYDELPLSTRKTLNVSLVHRFFTDQLEFINIAKNFVEVEDIAELVRRIIYPARSRGRLGGKSSGLFLGTKVIKKIEDQFPLLKKIKIPKTWYITSDTMRHFMHSNNLEEIIEQKYKEIERIRIEYPHLIQIFKNSPFPPDIVQALYVALDDFGDTPLIVRSSSLLEDRFQTAFSGKYKSLFVANQGSTHEKLEALTDAIAEVYASTFGPDPIEYRNERNLLDFNEQMGIMIQEVVGNKVGKYFFPSFAGVAFSNNEFRWSPRIQRTDGLIRLVPGLGTRAVDRIGDDYPILIAPGNPDLRVNVTTEEIVRYAPRQMDVINLEKRSFETIDIKELVINNKGDIPGLENVVSILQGDKISKPGYLTEYENEQFVTTFEGLRNDTDFVKTVKLIMDQLQENLNTPVDIEFASDGKNLYLLQCRPQSSTKNSIASPIPQNIPDNKVIFSADKYVSNGKVSNISHLVYVDPDNYNNLATKSEMLKVGRAISKLNKVLPRRKFILMGPGRWGSRGNIKLGVRVTYSDINNTAVLIEIAKKKGSYQPELSFGTHFFQDLVEASIRYLPLYPDDPGVKFNYSFLKLADNSLADFAPKFAQLEDTIKVIDLAKSFNGSHIKVLMNAELDQAIAYLSGSNQEDENESESDELFQFTSDDHWQWRLEIASIIADKIDPERFGVKNFYVFGSAKNATAGPASDLNMLIHVENNQQKQNELLIWLEGWNHCLNEMNYLRTGYHTNGILDVHLITDEDIEKQNYFARKINAVHDPAKKIPIK
jgi:pyruvate,water dikinase